MVYSIWMCTKYVCEMSARGYVHRYGDTLWSNGELVWVSGNMWERWTAFLGDSERDFVPVGSMLSRVQSAPRRVVLCPPPPSVLTRVVSADLWLRPGEEKSPLHGAWGVHSRSKVEIMGEVSRALGLWRTRLARREMMSDS